VTRARAAPARKLEVGLCRSIAPATGVLSLHLWRGQDGNMAGKRGTWRGVVADRLNIVWV
jgi:hypothetical protein